jgi:translation initiation factor IF-1
MEYTDDCSERSSLRKDTLLASEDLIRMDGKISDVTGGGNYVVVLDNGVSVTARLSGKMKKFKIRVLVGDRVTVGVSPYDPSHGLITHRQKAH